MERSLMGEIYYCRYCGEEKEIETEEEMNEEAMKHAFGICLAER